MASSRPRAVARLWRLPLFSLGAVLVVFAVFMALTALVDAAAGAVPQGSTAGSLLSIFVGAGLLIGFRPTRGQPMERLSLRGAFLLTAITWIIAPLFAAIPFVFAPEPLTLTDAVFETVSAITTTGSTVIVGLDDYATGLLLWRSLLQWIGGLGIIVMALVLLPFLRVGGMEMFRLESSESSGERVVAQASMLIVAIASVYLGLTVACAIAYAASGMTAFDAINHAMTTLATGGFSTRDASLGAYDSEAVRWTAVVFMLAGALPFVAYIKLVRGRASSVLADDQIRFFLSAIVLIVAGAHLARWAQLGDDVSGTLSRTAVNLVSVITTTGYASEDYQLWGAGFIGLFFAATFFGGCAGSTTGGIKAYRFQLLFFIVRDYMRGLYEPHVVQPRRYAGKFLHGALARSVLAFVAMYVGAVSIGSLALASTGLDLVTALSGAAQAMGNVGPGLGPVIGPAGNFQSVPAAAKWMLAALMLLGRLELFAVLVLFDPRFWRS
jgi:trk system potassium uptake protein TrkH